MHWVWDSQNLDIPTTPHILKQQSHTQEEQGAINPQKRPWMKKKKKEKWREHRAPSIPIPISTKRKEQEQGKKGVLSRRKKQNKINRLFVKLS